MIMNRAGDPVFISKDGIKRIRFDYNHSHGDRPHLHMEEQYNQRWGDATTYHRIYPLED